MGATRRATGRRALRWPILFVLVVILTLLCSWYYEALWTFGTYVLPKTVYVVQRFCNGTNEAASESSENREPVVHVPLPSSNDLVCNKSCECPAQQQEFSCPAAAAPPQKVVVEEKIVEKIVTVNSSPVFKEWWAQGKPWHMEPRFPRCSMDVCFDFSRCEGQDELLVYHYDFPSPPLRYFEGLNSTPWYTPDPDKACLFFIFQDVDDPFVDVGHPRDRPYWNNGVNHVLITFSDLWTHRLPKPETLGNASILSSCIYETTYRRGFDIGIPLPARTTDLQYLQSLKPFGRKYFITFRGTRYLGYSGEGTLRSRDEFRNMHNGKDVIVATSCRHAQNDEKRALHPELGKWCDEDEKFYDAYSFQDLMNSTFALAPAGMSSSSYRFIEIMSAGAIPVLIADNHVKPFEDLIQWPRCLLQFPTSQMDRIVPALRGMPRTEVKERQKYCLWAYNEFLKGDKTLLLTTMRALKARFYGVFAKFSETSSMYATKASSSTPAEAS